MSSKINKRNKGRNFIGADKRVHIVVFLNVTIMKTGMMMSLLI